MEAVYHSLRNEAEPELPLRQGGIALLLGIGKTNAPAPIDQDLREAYTDYLMEKYG
jgi:hypothetical protein